MYAGYLLDYGDDVTQYFQTNDFKTYHDIESTAIDEEVLGRWSLWLNSPWAYSHDKYYVEMNLSLKDNFSPAENFDTFPWRCYHEVIGYDGACAAIYGYGKTPEEAFMQCLSHNKYIQEKYNPNNISV